MASEDKELVATFSNWLPIATFFFARDVQRTDPLNPLNLINFIRLIRKAQSDMAEHFPADHTLCLN